MIMITAKMAKQNRRTALLIIASAALMFIACKNNSINSASQKQTEVLSIEVNDTLKPIVLYDHSATEPRTAELQRSITIKWSDEVRNSRIEELADIIKDHFTDEKINKYNDIIDRYLKGEIISVEEKEFYDKYDTRLANISGSVEGFVESIISKDDINDKAKINELNIINYNAYNYAFPIYRRILNGIAKYYDGENLTKDKRKEIDKLLNSVTNGNYGIAVKDRNNGTKTEFKVASK